MQRCTTGSAEPWTSRTGGLFGVRQICGAGEHACVPNDPRDILPAPEADLDLPKRAQPLLRPPAEIAGLIVKPVVPVEFFLR